MRWILILSFALLGCIKAAQTEDFVNGFSLPGLNFATQSFFAGYLTVGPDRHYYVYIPSSGNPSKDPVLVYLSYGPGCSSLYHWLYVGGPFVIVPGTNTFRNNPYAWNQKANLVYIDVPGGIGFSPLDTIAPSDEVASTNTFLALLNFFEKFPTLRDQPLYLSGEQYAGIVAPMVAKAIIEHNSNRYNPPYLSINLQGFLLENPCTMAEDCSAHHIHQLSPNSVYFLFHHQYLSFEQFATFYEACKLPWLDECRKTLDNLTATFATTNSSLRNIIGKCYENSKMRCLDETGILTFLNNNELKKAIHADENITFQTCNMEIFVDYQRSAAGSYSLYREFLNTSSQLKMWIVSEVLDGIVPTFSTRAWVDNLKEHSFQSPSRLWEGWYYYKGDKQRLLAGDGEQIGNLSLITLRSAAFMGLETYPEIQNYVLQQFLNNTGHVW